MTMDPKEAKKKRDEFDAWTADHHGRMRERPESTSKQVADRAARDRIENNCAHCLDPATGHPWSEQHQDWVGRCDRHQCDVFDDQFGQQCILHKGHLEWEEFGTRHSTGGMSWGDPTTEPKERHPKRPFPAQQSCNESSGYGCYWPIHRHSAKVGCECKCHI